MSEQRTVAIQVPVLTRVEGEGALDLRLLVGTRVEIGDVEEASRHNRPRL